MQSNVLQIQDMQKKVGWLDEIYFTTQIDIAQQCAIQDVQQKVGWLCTKGDFPVCRHNLPAVVQCWYIKLLFFLFSFLRKHNFTLRRRISSFGTASLCRKMVFFVFIHWFGPFKICQIFSLLIFLLQFLNFFSYSTASRLDQTRIMPLQGKSGQYAYLSVVQLDLIKLMSFVTMLQFDSPAFI